MVGRPIMAANREITVNAMLEDIEDHGNLSQACRDHHVRAATFLRWLEAGGEEQQTRYAQARRIGFDTMAEKALVAAQEVDDAAKGRLAWDATRWHLSKLAKHTYGDVTRTELTGKDGGAIEVAHTTNVTELATLLRARKRGDEVIEGEFTAVSDGPEEPAIPDGSGRARRDAMRARLR